VKEVTEQLSTIRTGSAARVGKLLPPNSKFHVIDSSDNLVVHHRLLLSCDMAPLEREQLPLHNVFD
jgi:hypothetical protein